MTALADIKAAIARKQADRKAVPFIGRRKTMVVVIGQSAARSIMAETTDHCVPPEIDGLKVFSTDQFLGWEVTER